MGLHRETADSATGAIGISDDGGKTWGPAIEIPNSGARLEAETDVIELKDGSLLAAQRGGQDFQMYVSRSQDRGQSWSESGGMGFFGHCPELHRTRDGIILLGVREPSPDGWQTGLRYSVDECKTWSKSVQIDMAPGAYPSMVNLKDGSVLVVYYDDEEVLIRSNIRAKRFRATPSGIEWLSL